MTCLYVVPNAYVHNFRRNLPSEGVPPVVTTLPGLVAQILKEGLVSYKEDRVLEEVAIWQTVQEHAEMLKFFAPISHYPGFMAELKWLFRQIDYGEDIFASMPKAGQTELRMLHEGYHQVLARHGILNAPGQMVRAAELAKEKTLLDVDTIKLQGLGDLNPLERALVETLSQGRSCEIVQPQVTDPVMEVREAADPIAEVEMIGKEIRMQIEAGVPLDKIGVAFPNPTQYMPILRPVFETLKVPWRVPEVSLLNTPLGKTILTLLLGELQGWHKHHLKMLTAPGWGLPLSLTVDDHRLLRLAPPLKGIPAWRSYLGERSSWNEVLELLADMANEVVTRPLNEYGAWLEIMLDKLQPELWVLPEHNLESWAELVKAWDGMQSIAHSLEQYTWVISPEQFIQLLESLLDSYQIQNRRFFAERVQIMSVEQLGAYTYDKLYVGGMVEGQFPPRQSAHWLTKTYAHTNASELYERLCHAAQQVFIYYPEVDRDGKLNLPATMLPKIEKETKPFLPEPTHRPSLFLGRGFLQGEVLLKSLQRRILDEGLSVSALNRYANCPYQFFCSYVLTLDPAEEVSLELDARAHGNIIHDVLQMFWEKYFEGPLPTLEDGQATIEGLLRREYARVGTQPSNKLIRSMRDFIRSDLGWAQKGFRPKHLEKWFQGLSIKTSRGLVAIRGRIDRIDMNADGAYVLYDYKTGRAPQINAMVAGKDVQIAAYLLAAENILPQGKNVGVAYYETGTRSRKGIFHSDYYKQIGVSKGKNVLEADEFIEQRGKFTEILEKLAEHILQGHFPIEPASARICSYCAFQGICRKEAGF